VGSGKEKESLNQLINKLELTQLITIIDWVDQEELNKLYSKSSLLIISSRSEGGPRVALEALANNLPVLSTDVGHMNIILPKELLAEPDNLESLKLLLETYVKNIDQLNQSAIFEFVRDEFSIEKQTSKVMKVYEDCFNSDL
jgi:glycosyltransferase involved in cell wall biosynthesis